MPIVPLWIEYCLYGVYCVAYTMETLLYLLHLLLISILWVFQKPSEIHKSYS